MDEPTREKWRAVPHTDGWFEVSDLGHVRTWKAERSRPPKRLDAPRLLTPRVRFAGYLQFFVLLPNYTARLDVHAAVAAAFLGDRPEGAVVCHWDDDRTNNRLDNLRYGTRQENKLDAVRNGRYYAPPLKTHCVHGHKFTAENTRHVRKTPTRTAKQCRTCLQAYRAKAKARRQSQEP